MIARTAGTQVVEQARAKLRRRVIQRELRAVRSGHGQRVSFAIDERGVDVAGLLVRATAGLRAETVEMQRLTDALKLSNNLESMVEGLAGRDVGRRTRSARIVGALGLEDAVAWLAPLLASREGAVTDAAARALGRIGGVRSAEALLQAILRAGPRRILITELARGAPDLFVEVVLAAEQRPGVTAAAAVAAGLRRRRTAVTPLLNLLMTGNRRQRAISCRSLGWIGARDAIPSITLALRDREWRVRVSAAKALAILRAHASRPDVEPLLGDRHLKVRMAAVTALRRLDGAGAYAWR